MLQNRTTAVQTAILPKIGVLREIVARTFAKTGWASAICARRMRIRAQMMPGNNRVPSSMRYQLIPRTTIIGNGGTSTARIRVAP